MVLCRISHVIPLKYNEKFATPPDRRAAGSFCFRFPVAESASTLAPQPSRRVSGLPFYARTKPSQHGAITPQYACSFARAQTAKVLLLAHQTDSFARDVLPIDRCRFDRRAGASVDSCWSKQV